MKNFILILISVSLVVTLCVANEYAVVSSKYMKKLSVSEVRAIFLKKLTILDDTKMIPINLALRDSLRLKFEQKILKMKFTRLKAYWTKQHYLGHRPPLSMKSQQSIKAFIKKVDGAIGYVDINNVDNSMHILYKWSD